MPRPLEPRSAHAELVRAAAADVLAYHCGDCHSSLAAPERLVEPRALDDLDALVASGRLVPLSSAGSRLVQLSASGAMPPADSGVAPLTQSDLDVLALFIDSPVFWAPPAAPAGCTPALPTLGFDQMFARVASDLAALPAADTAFQRYLALTNRSNAACLEDEPEHDRQALSKGLNMLSLGSSVRAPVAIDEAQQLYRIDLRDFDWLRSIELRGRRFRDVWEAIAEQSPYSVEFTGSDAALAKTATGTAFPLLFAEHLLDQALVGELYYAILGFADKELAALMVDDLGIDEYADFTDGLVRRAATTRSRLAEGDRVVQRYDLPKGGALWQSREFRSGGAASIFEDPFDSVPGPTQVMFTLPNGLFGFISADANDRLRYDTDFRFDLRAAALPSRGAIMCSACHASGLIGVVDEVKAVALRYFLQIGLDVNEIELLEQTYPEPAVFSELVARDSDAYQQALNELGLPRAGADPVARASLRFDAPLTLRDAAAELGVSSAALAENLARVDPALAPLAEGGTLGRDAFSRVYVASLCVLSESLTNRPNPAACERVLAPLGGR